MPWTFFTNFAPQSISILARRRLFPYRSQEDLRGTLLKFFHAVGAAAAAFFRGLSADQALPDGEVQFFPVHFGAVGTQNVHIEEAAQVGAVLDRGGDLFHFQGIRINDVVSFVPCDLVDLLGKKNRDPA